MKYKKMAMSVLLLLLGLCEVEAQKNTSTSGGDASGTGGTVSYTVGQAAYTAHDGTGGSVEQGVQQSYEISTVTGVEVTAIHLEIVAYPNPTIDYLNLQIENADIESFSYKLYDIQGVMKEYRELINGSTTINMVNLPEAIYFLKVSDGQQLIKTFKIIKN